MADKVVIALDIGTTFSGFAFSKRGDDAEVYCFENWPGALSELASIMAEYASG